MDDDGEASYETLCSRVLTSKYTFICVYWWMRQRIHNTSAGPRLESFYPPFVEGIDLPHQGVVDSYNPCQDMRQFFGDVTMGRWRHN